MRLPVWCAAALLTAGCTQPITGQAVRSAPGIDDDSLSPIDVETIMLDQAQMRAITGAGEDLSIIPSMDGKIPVDIEPLVEGAPPQCEWLFAETQTFGPDVEEFHKTTFQNPPDGGPSRRPLRRIAIPSSPAPSLRIWSDSSKAAAQPLSDPLRSAIGQPPPTR
jgi:hypothetical protein